METFLEVQFEGWTSTPRMPFILSGNAICMAVPSYSLLLGLIGCCHGRLISPEEVRIGYKYSFDGTAEDIETRRRLVYDGKRIKPNTKGADAYRREFHVKPRLTLWLNRPDWLENFKYPKGAPSLGRSQDLLKIISGSVRLIEAEPVTSGKINGCLIPLQSQIKSAGQLVQIAEAYKENTEVGGGRTATASRIFLAIPWMDEKEEAETRPLEFSNLFQTPEKRTFYLHDWQISPSEI